MWAEAQRINLQERAARKAAAARRASMSGLEKSREEMGDSTVMECSMDFLMDFLMIFKGMLMDFSEF